ncbi:MAG: hypothetical protein II440_00535 [Clostridia bacterium]|nr:hypothetical protein [Clostridia bacterium]
MQDKNKTTIIIMVVISLFIAALGFICGVLVYSQLTAQIAANGSGELIVEGYDIAGLINSAGQAGALVLSVMIVAASLAAILLQWLGYALVKLIKGVYKNQQGNNTQNNID